LSRPRRREYPNLASRIRSWELWSVPAPVRRCLLAVELLVALAAIGTLAGQRFTVAELARLLLVLGLALGFEELAIRVSRLRSRLAASSHVDMTSVWTFAGAVVLPLGLLAPLAIVVVANSWLRHHRSTGYRAYRMAYAAAAIIAAAYTGHGVQALVSDRLAGWPETVAAILAISLALAAYLLVNAGLLHTAIYLAVRPERLREVLPGWDDVWLEFATLCLGGLTGLALLQQPLLALLVVPPMFVLQRSVLTRQLEIAATTDAKTGLLNAATWYEVANIELVRAERESYGAALLIVDMDNFKLINDSHGHLAGDAVLKAVADALAEELRGYDSIGRFGGEEFVAVLSEVDELAALMVAERIRHRVAALAVQSRFDGEPALTGMSCSIGVACFPQHGTDTETLLHAADSALYAAKQAGRNQVQLSVA